MSMQGGEIATDRKTLEDLPAGTHAVFIYRYSSAKQSRIFPFIAEILQRGSSYLLYIAGKQGVKGIRLSMKDSGIDVASFERLKRLKIVDSEEWYVAAGKIPLFKPVADLQSQFSKIAEEALSSGSELVLVISEIDMLVRKGFYQNYLEFESSLGLDVSKFKSIFVCAYDEQELRAAGIPHPNESLGILHSSIVK